MDFGLGIILGALILYLALQKPLQFTVHHKYENIISEKTKTDLVELEQKMFKKDPESDERYDKYSENISDVMSDINDLMGGSDRDVK